jgi:hypothetical protein
MLTRKNAVWSSGSEQDNAFLKLKQALVEKPVLAAYSPDPITKVHTDVSSQVFSAIILQKQPDDILKPIAFILVGVPRPRKSSITTSSWIH